LQQVLQGWIFTPKSIISATDEELLNIHGVDISFIKKLRQKLGRV
tara:strand:- start:340 stop:474 length:135 start_codon:yes stop_codon:yes gene_type:complete